MTKLNDSWDSDIKGRIGSAEQRQALVNGAQKHGVLTFSQGRIQTDYENNGMYITISATAGKYPDMIPVTVDVFIPIPKAMLPKQGKSLEEINEEFEKEANNRPMSASGQSQVDEDFSSGIAIANDKQLHDLKSTQMDVVGDLDRHVDASSTVGSGTNEEPELPEVSGVGEGIQSEV